ncbi:MAG: ATP-binding cassette domain-containing protein [Bacilli bacterium]
MIQCRNITKIYESKATRVCALQSLNLSLPATGFIGILGPSGCGKTTLLNIVGGLDSQSEGAFFFEGKNTATYSASDWDYYCRESVGFVFQNYNLIPTLTVEENILLSLSDRPFNRRENLSIIYAMLSRVGLEKEAKKWPHELSGGQQQRVAIARALIKNPQLILADEPTGAVDSKTAHDVMQLLKEISENCLVIVVTHNEALAREFASRVIELKDGCIIKDSQENAENSMLKLSNKTRKKSASKSLGFFALLLINWRQFIQKIVRSILIVLAGSIGVVGVCLVLTISRGVQKYIIDIQRETLSNSPITIRSTTDNTNPNEVEENFDAYPTDELIHVVNRYDSYYGHINVFSDNFLQYLTDLDASLYNVIDYKTVLDMKVLTQMNGQYKRINNYKFMMMGNDTDYLSSQYDVLDGTIPTQKGDLAILVDQYNCIDVSVLNYLGIDFEGIDSYTFQEMTSKEYKVILNDDYYYKKPDETYGIYGSSQYPEMYINENNITLKITGILRLNPEAKTNIYDSGILYTKALRDYLINDAITSQIGQEQLLFGLQKNVFTGVEFSDSISISGTITKEYLYEAQLCDLGLMDEISTIRIYTDNFDRRVAVNEYIKDYNATLDPDDKILYYDYMGNFAIEFDAFVEVLTKTLMIFAGISLLVSSIMIGIITYISVMERIHDIGILRSLGASRRFIRWLFNCQNGMVGLLSGVIGILGASLFMKPIVGMMVDIMETNHITTFDISSLNFSNFGVGYFLLIIVANMMLAMIAGAVPAMTGSLLKPIEAINKE